jgi:hypothetical protein
MWSPPHRRFGFDYEKKKRHFLKSTTQREHARSIFCFFFKKVLSAACLVFFRFSLFSRNFRFLPPTPRARCALLLLLERDRETQKARGSIVDTLSPPRFDFFGARGVVFFSELYLSTFWKSELEKGTRAHTQLRRRF